MSNISLYPEGDFIGTPRYLDGEVHLTHINAIGPMELRSMKIEEGFRVRIRKGIDGYFRPDGDADYWWSRWFEAGEYPDLTKYHWFRQPDYPVELDDGAWVVEVEKVDYKQTALSYGYNDTMKTEYPVAPGEYPNLADGYHLPSEAIYHVKVAKWHKWILYAEDDLTGESLELEGGSSVEPKGYDLTDYNWGGRAKSCKIIPEDCELVGVTLDHSNETITDTGVTSAISGTLMNSTAEPLSGEDPVITTNIVKLIKTITTTQEWSSQMSYDVGMMLGLSIEEGIEPFGVGGKATETIGLSASFGQTFGKGGSTQTQETYDSEMWVQIPPGRKVEARIDAKQSTISGTRAVRTLRVKRTGETFNEVLTLDQATVETVTEYLVDA